MTITTHPDYLALLAGVLETPAEDSPRLVLADWLEENGEAARAEFIHIQCRAAEVGLCGHAFVYNYPQGCERCRLGCRERELLVGPAFDWFRVPGLATFSDKVGGQFGGWLHKESGKPGKEIRVDVRRGFPAAVSCTTEAFLAHADALLWSPGEVCRKCGGEKRIAETRQSWAGWRDCPDCYGTGRRPVPPTAQPIESVTLTSLPTSHVPDFNQLRRWIKPLGWGSDLRDSVETEWPQIKFKFPGDET